MMDLSVSVEKAKKLRLATREPRLTLTERASMRREKTWSAPVYGQSRSVSLDPGTLRRNYCVCFFSEAKELSYYKLLRTQIMQRCKGNDWNTIMVTSAVPGEGKTLTSLNLAAIFAKSFGQTAILVDCDLQRQNVHRYLGISSERGMTDYLKNNTPLSELIIWPKIEKLSLISGGEPVRESAELISSPKMAALAAELKARYSDRYVFYDLPPLLAEADALAFAPLADCILMVVHPGTALEDVNKALEMIPKEKFLGFVLNRTELSKHGYDQRYPYGTHKKQT
jgi:protein-tyrosine kinase